MPLKLNPATACFDMVMTPGGGVAVLHLVTDVGGPVDPTAGGNITLTGQVFSDGSVANTVTLSVGATTNTFLYGQGATTAAAELGPLTDGQLIIGATGLAPSTGSLAQPAAGITITPGAGTITFALANDLAAVEGLAGTGFAVRTAADTWDVRTLQAGTGITISNADGVAGNPTISVTGSSSTVDSFITDIAGPVVPTAAGDVTVTGTHVFSTGAVANTIGLGLDATQYTFLYGEGNNTNMSELGPLTNGQLIIGSTGVAPVAGSLTQPAAGLTIAGGAGSVTFALADDLAALEALAATGVASRTGASTWQTSAVTENAVVIGGATESLAMLTLTNGQLVIGSTGATPVAATPTSSDGSITITGGAGTLDFVVAAADDAILTLTGDTGGALSPTAGNINILGGPGVTVTGSGSTLTVNSVVYTDQTATTLGRDSGTFATAAGAYTLPASPTDGELVEIVCITTGIVVTANTGQEIQIGGDVTSTAGTATNSAKGDALVLRYRSTDTAWYAISAVGVWVLA